MATGQNITEAENNDLKVWYLFNYLWDLKISQERAL